jgi:glycerate 2-kinase
VTHTDLESIHAAAVAAALPGPATRSAVDALPLSPDAGPHLFALGKAAGAMASAAVAALAGRGIEPVDGVVVVPEAGAAPHRALAVVVGDHPVPEARSADAAMALAEAAGRVTGGDAIVLISGGASSLVGAPLPGSGVDAADLADLTRRLLGAGADIALVNAVRKRVARWGAGRLAVALAPARVHCLVVSDVIGDDPASIASGPCSPDETAAGALVDRLRRERVWDALPAAVARHLERAARGDAPGTPASDHPAFARTTVRVILSNAHARDGAAARARALGLGVVVHEEPLVGEAADCGRAIAHRLLSRRAEGARGECHVWGGEPTVSLHGAAPDALGGRMQALALAAATVLHDAGARAGDISLLAAGTDGRDGPTDAAGALVDAAAWSRIVAAGRDPGDDLARHRSYLALDAGGALLRTGLTGTNVADVVLGLI